MDKTCKYVLKKMNKYRKPESYAVWLFNDAIHFEAKKFQMSDIEFMNLIDQLVKEGFLEYIESSNGNKSGVRLTHKGLHYNKYTESKILLYIADKWIDFLALVIAIAAFIQSCIALAN